MKTRAVKSVCSSRILSQVKLNFLQNYIKQTNKQNKIKTELGNQLRRKKHMQLNEPVTNKAQHILKKLFLLSNHITVLNTKMLRIFLAHKCFF